MQKFITDFLGKENKQIENHVINHMKPGKPIIVKTRLRLKLHPN
jgi:hypothetical protein